MLPLYSSELAVWDKEDGIIKVCVCVCVCVWDKVCVCVCVCLGQRRWYQSAKKFGSTKERVLFIGTQFSNLYTSVYTPTRGRVVSIKVLI
jgi:hypothetical protein